MKAICSKDIAGKQLGSLRTHCEPPPLVCVDCSIAGFPMCVEKNKGFYEQWKPSYTLLYATACRCDFLERLTTLHRLTTLKKRTCSLTKNCFSGERVPLITYHVSKCVQFTVSSIYGKLNTSVNFKFYRLHNRTPAQTLKTNQGQLDSSSQLKVEFESEYTRIFLLIPGREQQPLLLTPA